MGRSTRWKGTGCGVYEFGGKGLMKIYSVSNGGVGLEVCTGKRDDIKDSDVEESSVADSKVKGGDVGCSSDTRKRKRMVFDDLE
ncbi:hypothetical protein Tco_0690267 [Tanacetum coccineum]